MLKNLSVSLGLLILRVSFGGLMLVHGWQKLAAYGDLAGKFPDPIGMGSQFSLLATIIAEFGCSILLILGLGTRLAALILGFTMAVALFVVHGDDPWQKKELAAVYLSVYATLLVTGGGPISVDMSILKIFRRKKPQPE